MKLSTWQSRLLWRVQWVVPLVLLAMRAVEDVGQADPAVVASSGCYAMEILDTFRCESVGLTCCFVSRHAEASSAFKICLKQVDAFFSSNNPFCLCIVADVFVHCVLLPSPLRL